MNLKDALRAQNIAAELDLSDRQTFQREVCQCCEAVRSKPTDPECVCDGLEWYLSRDGRVECQAHRFARALGGGKTSFAGIGIKK
jgi:hypothetical protein